MDRDFSDVIIIGAGLSGLFAALTLHEKEPSLSYLVLEAKDEIGGRAVSTADSENLLCFVSSTQTNLFDAIKTFNVSVDSNNVEISKSNLIICNGKIIKSKGRNAFEFCNPIEKLDLMTFVKVIEKMCQEPQVREDADENMEDFINRTVSNSTTRDILKFLILIHCGVEPLQITVGFYVFFCTATHGICNQINVSPGGGFRQHWIYNGAQEICKKIAESIPDIILLNEEVTKITCEQFQVILETRNNANNVIIAIPPPSNLKINFKPSLPKKKIAALRNIACGNLGKYVIIYPDAFWKRLKLSGEIYVLNGYSANQPLLCCFETTTNNKPVLCGYFLQKYGGSVKDAILKQLSLYFGAEALNPLEIVTEHCKTGSPMNVFRSYQDFLEFRNNNGRIFWAGAESAFEWYGCLEGALLAGKIAAFEALYDLRPAALSTDDIHQLIYSLTEMRRRHTNFSNIYKKAINWKLSIPVTVLTLYIIFKLWRRGTFSRFHRHLKNIIVFNKNR